MYLKSSDCNGRRKFEALMRKTAFILSPSYGCMVFRANFIYKQVRSKLPKLNLIVGRLLFLGRFLDCLTSPDPLMWLGKITDFGLKWGKGFRKRVAHPHPIFLEVSFRAFWSYLGHKKASHCARRSLRTPWKLELRIVA